MPALTSSPSTSETVCRATSFNQQLGGAWSISTAGKKGMFRNCPGSIMSVAQLAEANAALQLENSQLKSEVELLKIRNRTLEREGMSSI